MVRRCKHCRKTFTSNRLNQVYCSPKCRITYAEERKKASRSKRKAKKLEMLGLSNFGNYLVKECTRSGTIEVLNGHTPDSLMELLALTKKRTSFSGMTNGKCNQLYELSHIHPVRKDERIGLLHPSNLVIAPRTFNRERSTHHASGGLYLSTPLQRAFRVSSNAAASDVMKLIHKYLGEDLADFLKKAKLVKSTSNQKITRLVKLIAKTIPAPSKRALAEYEASLRSLSKQALTESVEASGMIVWKGDRGSASELIVALDELQRLQPENRLIEIIRNKQHNGRLSIGCEDPNDCNSYILKQCWLSLHGDEYSLKYKDKQIQDLLLEPNRFEPDF